MKHVPAIGLVVATIVLGFATRAPAQSGSSPEERTIINLRGDLYVARFDWRATVFLVTPEGIIVGDPISMEGAKWLRDELAARFPGRPVRYVLHTHHHFDRASGASAFGPMAETVGHREFNPQLQPLKRGSASYANVMPVRRSYDVRQRITLGGRSVEIIHTGRGHSADMSVLYFPDERTVFAVDHPDVKATPFSFGFFSPHEVAEWLDAVSTLDLDVLVSGDGSTFDPVAVRLLKPYVDDLVEAVTAGVVAGRTLGQLHAEVLLPSHRNNPHYAQRVAHIDRMRAALSVRQFRVYGAGAMNFVSANSAYCASYASCERLSGALPVGSVGFGVSFGRFGVLSEASAGGQLFGSRSSRFYDDEVANRMASVSVLLQFRAAETGRVAIDLLGGTSFVSSDTRGLDRVKEAEIPFGGRHDIVSSQTTFGASAGGDLSLSVSPKWSLRIPVRVTRLPWEENEFNPGALNVQVAVGLAYRLGQRIQRVPGRTAPIFMRRSDPPGSGAGPRP